MLLKIHSPKDSSEKYNNGLLNMDLEHLLVFKGEDMRNNYQIIERYPQIKNICGLERKKM